MDKKLFGVLPDGREVYQYTIRGGGLTCEILTYGGAFRALYVPDRDGRDTDILLGFDTLEDYLAQDKYIGALIGRCANRIGGASFELNGAHYTLAANDGSNHLHGGVLGFDKQLWTVDAAGDDFLALSLVSPDGQEGYPGSLSVRMTYRMEDGGLTLNYSAKSDKDTLCNLTNHAYFNLGGHAGGPVLSHEIQILADYYTPTDAGSIPTGAVEPVAGAFDLRHAAVIGKHIDDDNIQLRCAGGYDHNWVIQGTPGTLRPAVWACCPDTGIVMDVLTTQPGVQFYSGNYLDGCPRGKDGVPYAKRWGFCLETQSFPDSPHHSDFPSAILKAGEEYRQTTVYRFSVR